MVLVVTTDDAATIPRIPITAGHGNSISPQRVGP